MKLIFVGIFLPLAKSDDSHDFWCRVGLMKRYVMFGIREIVFR